MIQFRDGKLLLKRQQFVKDSGKDASGKNRLNLPLTSVKVAHIQGWSQDFRLVYL